MKVLLIGAGLQGKAALYDLVRSGQTTAIVAADSDIEQLKAHVAAMQYGDKVHCAFVDATVPDSLQRLVASGPDVIINLLPTEFITPLAALAVQEGIHLVFTSYPTPEVWSMHHQARAREVTILPEFGLDPGIDLVLLGEAVRSLDEVEEIIWYGTGLPEAEAADNAIRYKITWTLEGVLKAYYRPARLIRDGEVVEIGADEIFAPENVALIDIPGLGRVESYANGDALPYAQMLGLAAGDLRQLGRYTLRYPGHSAFWRTIVDLHLLDPEPVLVDGVAVDRKRFLAAAMAPHLQLKAGERDVVLVRVEVKGRRDGRSRHLVYQMTDRRDLETGLLAMNRTVGFTASIGALMIGRGELTKRGVLSPVRDIPYEPFVAELAARGIEVTAS